jgi:hypothetical protein
MGRLGQEWLLLKVFLCISVVDDQQQYIRLQWKKEERK